MLKANHLSVSAPYYILICQNPISILSLGTYLYAVGTHHGNQLMVCDYEQGDLLYSVDPHSKLR